MPTLLIHLCENATGKDMEPIKPHIAPLKIDKQHSNFHTNRFYFTEHSRQMTPPLTPSTTTTQEHPIMERTETPRAVFHNYLRAFYPFHPSGDLSPSTVTLPLDQGDIILVHSVHTNGWADGTLLDTGARGWLPTNYCEAYDQLPMRPLLKALTDFWDIIRGGCGSPLTDFRNQDLVRGLIAGVRFLLVSPPNRVQPATGLTQIPGKIRMSYPGLNVGPNPGRVAQEPESPPRRFVVFGPYHEEVPGYRQR